jgi:hypothetical protein
VVPSAEGYVSFNGHQARQMHQASAIALGKYDATTPSVKAPELARIERTGKLNVPNHGPIICTIRSVQAALVVHPPRRDESAQDANLGTHGASHDNTCNRDNAAERKTPERQGVQVARPKAAVESHPAARLNEGDNDNGGCGANEKLANVRDARHAHAGLPTSCNAMQSDSRVA